MWIQHKAREGDTLSSIVKQYKNKDPNAILKYPGNSKIAARLKKGEALKAGEVVWVLDPKGKVYIIRKNGKDVILDEKEFKEFQKTVQRKMNEMVRRFEVNYSCAADRHRFQIDLNNEQWFVAGVLKAISSVPEPDWKPAYKALGQVQAAFKKSDYKGFEAAAVKAEVAITDYENGVYQWIEGLISAGDKAVHRLGQVKEVGKFCGTLAAVTIAAPATLGAAVVVGAAASGGVGLLYDGAENASLAHNDMKTMSAGEIGSRLVANVATGAAGAVIAGNLLKLVKGPLADALLKSKIVKVQALRLATRVLPKQVFAAELKGVLAGIAKGGTIHVDKFVKMVKPERIMVEAMIKFLTRLNVGVMMKSIGASKAVSGALLDWVKSAPKELQGSSPAGAVSAVTKKLETSDAAAAIFDDILAANMKEFRKVLAEVIEEHVRKLEKQAA